jgi:methyl-accepting chemotaxis protein
MRILRPFEEMTIPRRVAWGYGMLLVLMLVLAGVCAGAVIWVDSWTAEYRDSTRVRSQTADRLPLSTAALGGYALALVADRDDSAQYQSWLEADLATAKQALDSLAILEADDAENAAAVESMRDVVNQLDLATQDAIALAPTSPSQAIIKATMEIYPLGQQLREAATSYSDKTKAQELASLDGLNRTFNILLVAVLAGVAGAIALSIALSVRISRKIAGQLRTAIARTSTAAAEMLAISSQVAAGAAQTAASTNETTATVEEVKQTAMLTHEKASQVAESSQNVAEVAEAGRTTVEETISGIDRMQNQMGVVSQTINQLSDQTQAVGEIIATVNDLAEQSNLLSVNASIEAAKAGEHGKGFTVVAQEVKNLAEQSKQAVAQVRTILTEIQKAGRLAVQAADQSIESIEAGKHQSLKSGDAIQMLAQTATEAAQSAVQISASSRQQLVGMEQISHAMDAINEASNQSVSGTRQVEHEAQQLQELAVSLKRLLDADATA